MEDAPSYGTNSVPKIYSSLKAIMDDISPIVKGGYNTFHKFKFRSIDQLMNELHPIFKKNNVIILTEIHSHEITQRDTNKEGKQFYSDMVIAYRLVCTLDGSEVKCLVPSGAADNGDKHFSKAMSMGLKYMLNQMFLIPTGDPDADSEVHDSTGSYKEPEKKAEPVPQNDNQNNEIMNTCRTLFENNRNRLRAQEVRDIEEALKTKDVEKVKAIVAFLRNLDDKAKGV